MNTTTKLEIKDWVLAARPWSYTASAMPIITTLSFFLTTNPNSVIENWHLAILSVISIILLHSSGNLISDYFDFIKGVDREGVYGQTILVEKKFKPNSIKIYGYVCLALGSLIGLYIGLNTHFLVIIIGGIGFISSLFYFFFKKNALGDFLIFISFGFLPTIGTGYMIEGELNPWLMLLSLPVGAITIAILHSNNTRDIDDDSKAGITTLASFLGVKFSIYYYAFLVIIPYLVIILMVALGVIPYFCLLNLISFPIALKNIKHMQRARISHHEIGSLDQITAQHQLIFTLGLSITLIISYLL